MTTPPRRTVGLPLGIASLIICTLGLAVWLMQAGPGLAPTEPSVAGAPRPLVLDDPATRAFLDSLSRAAPAQRATLDNELARARSAGANDARLAQIAVRAAMAQFRQQALALRSASTEDYDRLLAIVRDGLESLQARQSNWCHATRIETLLRQPTPALIDTVLAEFAYDTPQYAWLMAWSAALLDAAYRADISPTRHGPRTARDKLILQDFGRSLAAREWGLALEIAAFSQAEGRGYDTMRDTIDSIDVCELGIAAIDLSGQLPVAVRGRIWSELLPEILYGNTPYALYLVTGYFFID